MNPKLWIVAPFGASVLSLILALVSTVPALARTNYAIIVGVTEYPQFAKDNWLEGPRNDALLVREYLTKQSPVRFEPANVSLLIEQMEGAREPTLTSILSTLDAMANKVRDGDFVYAHFSGHGFQQPAADPSTETDGLDEIFLPKDTGRWVDPLRGLPNALVDDKIGQKLAKIRASGAFVWLIFDACNSGTATRAAPVENVRERRITRETAGIPPEVLTEAHRNETRTLLEGEKPDEVGSGGMVAFFAAQSNETTPEMPLPNETSETYGLFTYTLLSKLAENPRVNYRQLAEGILQHYASMNRTSTTPLFEGDLDAPVFGITGDKFIPQWPIELVGGHLTVPAGLLHGLAPRTRLAILEGAGSKTEDAIGFAEVTSASNFSSQLVLAAAPEVAARNYVRALEEIPRGSYARLVEASFDFTLTVARPPTSGEFPDEAVMVNELLDTIAADESAPLRLELEPPGEHADLRLAVLADERRASRKPALWFLPESGEASFETGRTPPSIGIDGNDKNTLRVAIAQYLVSIYRATNLGRISQYSDYGSQEIDLTLTLRKKLGGPDVQIVTTSNPVVAPGDRVRVQAKNKTSSPVDLNILYIGGDYSITHIGKERLQPSTLLKTDFLEFTDTSYGRELMVAVFTEARPLTPTLDLGHLGQKGLRSVMEDGAPDSVENLIQSMSYGATPRGVKSVKDSSDGTPRGSIMLIPVRVVPTPSGP